MIALLVILVAFAAACLGSLLRDAPERRLEQHPRGSWPGSPRR